MVVHEPVLLFEVTYDTQKLAWSSHASIQQLCICLLTVLN